MEYYTRQLFLTNLTHLMTQNKKKTETEQKMKMTKEEEKRENDKWTTFQTVIQLI